MDAIGTTGGFNGQPDVDRPNDSVKGRSWTEMERKGHTEASAEVGGREIEVERRCSLKGPTTS